MDEERLRKLLVYCENLPEDERRAVMRGIEKTLPAEPSDDPEYDALARRFRNLRDGADLPPAMRRKLQPLFAQLAAAHPGEMIEVPRDVFELIGGKPEGEPKPMPRGMVEGYLTAFLERMREEARPPAAVTYTFKRKGDVKVKFVFTHDDLGPAISHTDFISEEPGGRLSFEIPIEPESGRFG